MIALQRQSSASIMSRSSEDVLLQLGQVKYKKYEGNLFVMSERIGWMPGNKSNFSVVHKYTEIKSQVNTRFLLDETIQY